MQIYLKQNCPKKMKHKTMNTTDTRVGKLITNKWLNGIRLICFMYVKAWMVCMKVCKYKTVMQWSDIRKQTDIEKAWMKENQKTIYWYSEEKWMIDVSYGVIVIKTFSIGELMLKALKEL